MGSNTSSLSPQGFTHFIPTHQQTTTSTFLLQPSFTYSKTNTNHCSAVASSPAFAAPVVLSRLPFLGTRISISTGDQISCKVITTSSLRVYFFDSLFLSCKMASAPKIPLKCDICPRKPRFSDVSHLLTHISSKTHLSNIFKARVRLDIDTESRRLVEDYDQWYAEWSIQDLLAERLSQKDTKMSRPRKTGKFRRVFSFYGQY
jgi:hypothetical protein